MVSGLTAYDYSMYRAHVAFERALGAEPLTLEQWCVLKGIGEVHHD